MAISPRPDDHSRAGSELRAWMSQITADGCQKAPTRFLPWGRFTPVFPPMAASTWASRVVATVT